MKNRQYMVFLLFLLQTTCSAPNNSSLQANPCPTNPYMRVQWLYDPIKNTCTYPRVISIHTSLPDIIALMRRWLSLSLALILMLSALSVISIWLGHQQPIPEHLAIFHFDLCKPPCWIGISPGVTKWHEAEILIRKVFTAEEGFEVSTFEGSGYTSGSNLVAIISNKSKRFELGVNLFYPGTSHDDEPIFDIELTFDTLEGFDGISPSFSDISSVLGEPLFVAYPPYNPYSFYLYNSTWTQFEMHINKRFSPSDGVYGIRFSSNPLNNLSSEGYTVEKWQGFASLQKYGVKFLNP